MTERIAYSEIPSALIECMMATEKYVNSCGFSARLLELIRFRASQLNCCAYCIDMHHKDAIHAGESPHRLYSLSAWNDTSFYTDEEKAALRWTEAITLLPEDRMSDRMVEEMYRFFDKATLANLTMAIVQINGWNRLAKSFGFEPGHYQAGGR